jgi:hypothetical protein
MNALGQFFGHIAKGVKTDPTKLPTRQEPAPLKRELRREVEVEEQQTPKGKITLRRTTIEEIELPPEAARDIPRGTRPDHPAK